MLYDCLKNLPFCCRKPNTRNGLTAVLQTVNRYISMLHKRRDQRSIASHPF